MLDRRWGLGRAWNERENHRNYNFELHNLHLFFHREVLKSNEALRTLGLWEEGKLCRLQHDSDN